MMYKIDVSYNIIYYLFLITDHICKTDIILDSILKIKNILKIHYMIKCSDRKI